MNTVYVDFNNMRPDGLVKGHKTSSQVGERVQVVDYLEDMQVEAVIEALTENGLPLLRMDEATQTGTGWA